MKSLVNSSEVHNIGLLLLIAAWLWWLLSLQIVSMELRATTRNILLLLTAALVLLYQTSVEQRRLIGQTKALLARPVFERWGWFTVADVLVMVGILLYSVLSFMGNWQGRTGFMPLSSDPANIATFVAARLHPEFFANDSLLGVPANFYFYVALHLPLVATLGEWLGGNYGLATAYLFLPHLFLQGVGFYLLGKELFRDRFWSMLLVGITFLPFSMNWGEFWGTLYDVMPRVTFQVLLPYVLWVTVRWRNSVKKWPYVLMLAGLLIYVHPVSAPAWILSIWLSLVVGTSKTTFKNNVVDGIRAGLALLVVVLPYVWFYLTNYAHGEVIDYALTRQIWSERLYPGFVDLGYGFREFINVIVIEREVELFIVGGLAVLFSFLPLRQHDAALARLLQVWLVGILLASVVIPIIDFSIAVHLERLPLQVDLVRNLRYLFPLLLLFSLWAPFAVASGALFGLKLSDRGPRVVLVLTLFWCAWLAKFHQPSMALDAVKCMVARNLFCPISQQERQAEEVLNAIRTLVPPDQSILANALVLEIRYHALRSVAFASKDGGAFLYSTSSSLFEWYEQKREFDELLTIEDAGVQMVAMAHFARELGAGYLLVDEFWQVAEVPTGMELLFSNSEYALLVVE